MDQKVRFERTSKDSPRYVRRFIVRTHQSWHNYLTTILLLVCGVVVLNLTMLVAEEVEDSQDENPSEEVLDTPEKGSADEDKT